MNEQCELVVIGECTVPRDWIGLVRNSVNRLYYIHRGHGGYIKDGEKIEFTPGRLYLIPALSKIRTYAPAEDRIYHSYADYELIPPIISNDVLSLDPYEDEDTLAAMNVFISLCKKQATLESRDKTKYLEDTVVYLSKRIAEKNNSTLLRDKTIISALQIMHSRVTDKLSIADIAEECHMSSEGFIRKFKTYIGETPYNYLKRLKIRAALKIRRMGATWSEAAEAVGYSDTSTLLHAIKNEKYL